MATNLLRYRPTPNRHDDWLHQIEELIAAAVESAALSCSVRPQPSLANNEEPDVPPPPLRRVKDPEPRQEARPRARPREPRAGSGDEVSCRMIPRPRANACAPPALQVPHQERAPLEADPIEQQELAAPHVPCPLEWWGASPSPPSSTPLHGPTNSSLTFPHVMMEPKTRLSSYNSTR
ncbi:hypothetical protein ZWY2020_051026 [Hordeum vulgare]|nr:hypothetical protein ZWY2020_051026 [Hordeum vulgare]